MAPAQPPVAAAAAGEAGGRDATTAFGSMRGAATTGKRAQPRKPAGRVWGAGREQVGNQGTLIRAA